MGIARLLSRGQDGLEAYEVSVEVDIAGGLPAFTITGLPTGAVRESRDRVRAALNNCGVPVPSKRVTVHLGPADIPKEGGRFDLPIALGIVNAELRRDWRFGNLEFVGELSLAGELRAARGVFPAALAASRAGRRLIVPQANAREAALVPSAAVSAARHLQDVFDHLNGDRELPAVVAAREPAIPSGRLSLDDVGGHALPKRALMIAAAGAHNLLMVGPPGSGKSMLAERLPGLLPPLDDSEWLEVASIASIAGTAPEGAAARLRPFRCPHHSTPATALIGGGVSPRPGEISRAHHGVLFLDELPEFSRGALEALREPLETGNVTISRLRRQTRYPARFQIIAAMNPCPCGYQGDPSDRCECPPMRLRQYRGRVSGPLLDRFDLHIPVERVPLEAFGNPEPGLSGHEVRDTVLAARRIQLERRGQLNRELDGRLLLGSEATEPAARDLLDKTEKRWLLSTRSLIRVLRVARTIADIGSAPKIRVAHVAEALQYRCMDRPTAGGVVQS